MSLFQFCWLAIWLILTLAAGSMGMSKVKALTAKIFLLSVCIIFWSPIWAGLQHVWEFISWLNAFIMSHIGEE